MATNSIKKAIELVRHACKARVNKAHHEYIMEVQSAEAERDRTLKILENVVDEDGEEGLSVPPVDVPLLKIPSSEQHKYPPLINAIKDAVRSIAGDFTVSDVKAVVERDHPGLSKSVAPNSWGGALGRLKKKKLIEVVEVRKGNLGNVFRKSVGRLNELLSSG